MSRAFTYQNIVNSFLNKKILVIGDLILDVYLKGVSTRLSPEAPVPVVDITDRKSWLGGSANTACNLKSLGADVTYLTAIGTDTEGDEAIALLEKLPIILDSIFRIADRQTIVKSRVVSGTHVVTRFDVGTQSEIDTRTEKSFIEFLEKTYEQYDAVILSDYDKGIITSSLIEALGRLQEKYKKFLAIDSKRLPFFANLRPSLVKPNYDEVIKLLNIKSSVNNRVSQLMSEGETLYQKTHSKVIAVTLDQEGSLFFENGRIAYRAHAPAINTPHVAGAGDTFLSALTLASIECHCVNDNAEIATAAATIAVSKESTSSCSAAELKCYFHIQQKYIASFDDLKQLCDDYKNQGKRIVFTNGCFDILHSGHVTYLHCAKERGDILIVGVNNDESIKRLKGNGRPINPLADRIQVLSGLISIDHIVAFGNENDDTPIPVIKIVRPNVFVKGGDYTKEKLPEAKTIEDVGGEIAFIPFIPDHSTTSIIQRITSVPSPASLVINR